jgi:uncharacterized membrane protein YcaP (DUF421 family)
MTTSITADMFVLGVPLLEKILRSLVVYLFLVLSLRLASKRLLAQLNPFDLVVLLILSNTVQNAVIGNDNSVAGGIVSAVTLLAVNSLVVRILFKHGRLNRLLEGDPDVLIEHGALKEDALRAEVITRWELVTAAHKQGFDSIEEIEKAVLEPGGAMLFFRHPSRTEDARHKQLLERLDRIERQLGSRP